MADWTVAVWIKPQERFQLRTKADGRTVMGGYIERPTEFDRRLYRVHACPDWQVRARFGDFIDFKSYADRHIWTEIERTRFLIISMTGTTKSQMQAFKEPYWDVTSIKQNIDQAYVDNFPEGMENRLMPNKHFAKRRMMIPEATLINFGADMNRVKDLNDDYVPNMPFIEKTEFYDKMRERKVLGSDKHNKHVPPSFKRGDNLQAIKDEIAASQIIASNIDALLSGGT